MMMIVLIVNLKTFRFLLAILTIRKQGFATLVTLHNEF